MSDSGREWPGERAKVPDDLKAAYRATDPDAICTQSYPAKHTRMLIERIAALTAELDTLRAQVERLSAPVSNEEWHRFRTIAFVDGHSLRDEFVYRDEVDALIHARAQGKELR